ncbi:transcription antitermination factor NusB [Corynebacterium caspium]|uniref:transcription antitermination factor NusB n=1 Tax=Corynebacterium caspium TaxID=234828 RepID=UPI00035DEABC|nr:transcription antitermination factor NusB [Corynebacterium caspium]WKD59208.1 hypothetical protein CCASP_04055 [Corynebacterium caspium DSM 44850]
MTKPENKFRRHGARYRARRRAVDILFEAEARDVDPVAVADDRANLAIDPANAVAPVAPYTREIVIGVAEHLDEIDEIIEAHLLETWELERLPAVDRAILRMSTWELLFNKDVPWKTAIVEGVELAAEYGAEPAHDYIHAALDEIAKKRNSLGINLPEVAVAAPDFFIGDPADETEVEAEVEAEPEAEASPDSTPDPDPTPDPAPAAE